VVVRTRNKILSVVGNADIIIFFDDDFFADYDYLSNVEKLFLARPDVVAATGSLFADGALGPGRQCGGGFEDH